jgi:hypothetical protein
MFHHQWMGACNEGHLTSILSLIISVAELRHLEIDRVRCMEKKLIKIVCHGKKGKEAAMYPLFFKINIKISYLFLYLF